MFLQLIRSVKSLSALQTPDLVPFRLLIAPAACVLLVLLEVLLTKELSQTRHTVDAFRFTLVLAVQPRQAEVAAASYTGVRQQAKMGETVFQESILLGKCLCAVCAFKIAMTRLLPVTLERFLRGEIAATHLAYDIQPTFV